MLYTPLLPGPPAPRSTRATSSCRCARSCAAPTCADRRGAPAPTRRPTARARASQRVDGEQRRARLRPARSSRSGRSRGRCRFPGLAEHAIGPEVAVGCDRAAQPGAHAASTSPSRSRTPSRRAEYSRLRVRRCRLRGRRGARPSCRTSPRRRSSSIRAAAPAGDALGARRGPRADHAARCRRALSAFAERELRGRGIEVRHAHARCARSTRATARRSPTARRRSRRARSCGRPASSRARPSRALGLPLDAASGSRSDSRRPTMRVARQRRGLGDRRLRRGARPVATRAGRCPPTAQHAIRQGRLRRAQRRRDARAGAPPRPFRYRTTGVVAELGRNKAVAITLGIRWRGLAGMVDRAHLSPAADARARAASCACSCDWNVALRRSAATPSSPGTARQPDAARRRRRGEAPPRTSRRADRRILS